jgi:hypothetical protein
MFYPGSGPKNFLIPDPTSQIKKRGQQKKNELFLAAYWYVFRIKFEEKPSFMKRTEQRF